MMFGGEVVGVHGLWAIAGSLGMAEGRAWGKGMRPGGPAMSNLSSSVLLLFINQLCGLMRVCSVIGGFAISDFGSQFLKLTCG